MEFKELKITLKRLYDEHVKFHLNRIFLCLILSICIAGTTSAIAWLLDPAVKILLIKIKHWHGYTYYNNFTFAAKGLSFILLD